MLSIIVALCNAALGIILVLGSGYVVFALDRSPWWFLVAFIIYVAFNQQVKILGKEIE